MKYRITAALVAAGIAVAAFAGAAPAGQKLPTTQDQVQVQADSTSPPIMFHG